MISRYSLQNKELTEKGYLLIPNLLSVESINEYRQILMNYFENPDNHMNYSNAGKGVSNSFGFIPELKNLLSNKKIIDTLSNILEHDTFYLHHCDVHCNRLSSWHKDSTGYIKNQWEEREGKEKFKLYKIAFYLQDHSNNNDGLTVKEGSHLIQDLKSGKNIILRPKIGDAILFDQRITHVGKTFGLKDKIINTFFKHNQIKRTKVSSYIDKILGKKNKISIFWGLGENNNFSKEFALNIIKRQNRQNKTKQFDRYNDVKEYLEKVKVKQLQFTSNDFLKE